MAEESGLQKVDGVAADIAAHIGYIVARLDPVSASFWLSKVYTMMLQNALQSSLGIYYTPHDLTFSLLKMTTNLSDNWQTCRVLYPACGGV